MQILFQIRMKKNYRRVTCHATHRLSKMKAACNKVVSSDEAQKENLPNESHMQDASRGPGWCLLGGSLLAALSLSGGSLVPDWFAPVAQSSMHQEKAAQTSPE